ncbi:hypothetical protein OBBRIDRAFT_740161 [Obba rivulosa]|uniref:Uncharacterized protein n=1 Tax=Obba rivulosa TaxID=1052685 RepID=A0A8E2DGX6_9APHY|nr:hypothetical protein OBBRIDRAFT_740161 [Obba rivulosa]
MYLVGVIPGPTKPSLSQVNHFIKLLVDDLLVFWNPGMFYSSTPNHPRGRRVHAVMVPLVSDLLAARQVSGMASHSFTYFCSVCYLKLEDIANFEPSTWPLRDSNAHRAHAESWNSAQSTVERETLFKSTGVRWSQLLRLPYWDPIHFTVIDSMHNLYLGLLKTHCREIWGMSIKDDDSHPLARKKMPPRPSQVEMNHGVFCLYNLGKAELMKCGKAVLWHLCADRDVHCSKTIKYFFGALLKWVSDNTLCDNIGPRHKAPRNSARIDVQRQLDAAEDKLRTATSPRDLSKVLKSILVIMCDIRGLSRDAPSNSNLAFPNSTHIVHATVQQSGIPFLATRIDNTRRSGNSDGKKATQSHALGRQTLMEIFVDKDRMQLPSWINPIPRPFGSGKLSADQWKTACTINLPITLIRMWGTESDGLKQDMLANFLDLATVVVLASQHQITEKHIQGIEIHLRRYLEGMKRIYKATSIKPNHHLAMHLPHFLRLFSPVHAWHAFAFERYNYMLQNVKTDMRFGELETTMMLQVCRAANLRPLLDDSNLQVPLDEVIQVANEISAEDRRGIRLESISTDKAAPGLVLGTSLRSVTLEPGIISALKALFDHEEGPGIYVEEHSRAVGPHQYFLTRDAIRCNRIKTAGIWYSHHAASARDSNVVFRSKLLSQQAAGRIQDILVYTRTNRTGTAVEEAFLVVERLVELDAEHRQHDLYRNFPVVGGRLTYSRCDPKLYIIRPVDIVCHAAITTVDIVCHAAITTVDVKDIEEPCVHVLPLAHVSPSWSSYRLGQHSDPAVSLTDRGYGG